MKFNFKSIYFHILFQKHKTHINEDEILYSHTHCGFYEILSALIHKKNVLN